MSRIFGVNHFKMPITNLSISGTSFATATISWTGQIPAVLSSGQSGAALSFSTGYNLFQNNILLSNIISSGATGFQATGLSFNTNYSYFLSGVSGAPVVGNSNSATGTTLTNNFLVDSSPRTSVGNAVTQSTFLLTGTGASYLSDSKPVIQRVV